MNLITYAFNRISEKTKWGAFEMLVTSCFIFIITFAVYRMMTGGGGGTWTNKELYDLIPPSRRVKTATSSVSSKKQGGDSKGETECRRVLETVFGKSFSKARPDFLSNPITGGNNLELDCYNDELKIACEYNGIQHYEFIPYFHKNKDQFQTQKYRDDMKRRVCKEQSITLIEVSYTVKIKDIESYIVTELRKQKLI
jgi:hypothetical protein